MRVGVDLSCWNHQRGYGRYARNLLTALFNRPTRHTFTGFIDAAALPSNGIPGIPAHVSLVAVPQSAPPTTAASADGRRKLSDLWRVSRAIQRSAVDVMFFPSTYTYVPVLGGSRCVVVIHDAIAERLPSLIFPARAGRLAWTLKSRLACRQADRVITVSHSAARAIRANLPVPTQKLRVIYEAADPVFRLGSANETDQAALLQRLGLPEGVPLLLYVGGFSPHKNVESLLTAFAHLRQAGECAHLALVGETTGEVFFSCFQGLRERVNRLGLRANVTFTGFVPDADLVRLYQASLALILPSRDEGFGLPAVEAMACGTPVIASHGGALPELVGDVGLLVDPDCPAAFAATISRLLHDATLAATLRQRGLRRAEQLSWATAAAETLAVFDELTRVPAGWRPVLAGEGHARA